jgi:hypothetical protein
MLAHELCVSAVCFENGDEGMGAARGAGIDDDNALTLA